MGRFPLQLIFSISPAHFFGKKVRETPSVKCFSFQFPFKITHIKIVFSSASIVELNLS